MTDIAESTLKKLASLAKEVSTRAYCPYSKFSVGAAILTESGEVFTGCNVENASFGLTICAERNAIFRMVSEKMDRIKAVVIYTSTQKPASPCGACRQVINEFGPMAEIISICDSHEVLSTSLAELLPHAFGPEDLSM